MKSWLQDNYIEIYSTYNEEKSTAAERFIRTLMNKFYKYMNLIPKKINIEKSNKLYVKRKVYDN